MKVVILAGGVGSRLAEVTDLVPKPMVEIGGRPMLWHIMAYYASFGFSEFFVLLGYKGEVVKRFFVEYATLSGSISVSLSTGEVTRHDRGSEEWVVNLIDTGLETNTGGRVKRLEPWLGNEPFMLTYGDGLSNVDLRALLSFHKSHGRVATVTAVRPPARFGGLIFDGDLVKTFTEKPQVGEGWINGGFFVFEPGLMPYLEGDGTSLEADALEALAAAGELAAYRHDQFWQCMDTMRDKRLLEGLWASGQAPWKAWV